MSWVFEEIGKLFDVPGDRILGAAASKYVPTVIDKVCGDPPPKGVFYLVRIDDQLAGMGGLRYLQQGVCEIKRIYFRPQFRGMKLGEMMLKRLIADASDFGYHKACLDSGPFMTFAHRLYEANGFVDCGAYEGVEVPTKFHSQWRFMERDLASSGGIARSMSPARTAT
jgi:GNAT superfamily N-acetyltransferase